MVKKIPEEHLYQEENDFKNKNLNHVYYKDITQKRNAKNVQEYDDNSYSLWDTINLSYAGNMDLANAVGKVKYSNVWISDIRLLVIRENCTDYEHRLTQMMFLWKFK